jgi:hypothetical protein
LISRFASNLIAKGLLLYVWYRYVLCCLPVLSLVESKIPDAA